MLWQQHPALPHQVSEAANWGLAGTAADGDSGGAGGAGPTCPGAGTLQRASWSRDRPWGETVAAAASRPGQEGARGAAGAPPPHTAGGGGVLGVPGVPLWRVGPGKCLGQASAGVHPWGVPTQLGTLTSVRFVCPQACAQASACAQAGEHTCTHTHGGTRAHVHTHAVPTLPFSVAHSSPPRFAHPFVRTHALTHTPRHAALPMCASLCPHPKPPPGQKQRRGRWLALAMGWLPLPMATDLGTPRLPQAPARFPSLPAHFSPPSAGARPVPTRGLRGRRPLAPCELPFVILCLSDAWRLGR